MAGIPESELQAFKLRSTNKNAPGDDADEICDKETYILTEKPPPPDEVPPPPKQMEPEPEPAAPPPEVIETVEIAPLEEQVAVAATVEAPPPPAPKEPIPPPEDEDPKDRRKREMAEKKKAVEERKAKELAEKKEKKRLERIEQEARAKKEAAERVVREAEEARLAAIAAAEEAERRRKEEEARREEEELAAAEERRKQHRAGGMQKENLSLEEMTDIVRNELGKHKRPEFEDPRYKKLKVKPAMAMEPDWLIDEEGGAYTRSGIQSTMAKCIGDGTAKHMCKGCEFAPLKRVGNRIQNSYIDEMERSEAVVLDNLRRTKREFNDIDVEIDKLREEVEARVRKDKCRVVQDETDICMMYPNKYNLSDFQPQPVTERVKQELAILESREVVPKHIRGNFLQSLKSMTTEMFGPNAKPTIGGKVPSQEETGRAIRIDKRRTEFERKRADIEADKNLEKGGAHRKPIDVSRYQKDLVIHSMSSTKQFRMKTGPDGNKYLEDQYTSPSTRNYLHQDMTNPVGGPIGANLVLQSPRRYELTDALLYYKRKRAQSPEKERYYDAHIQSSSKTLQSQLRRPLPLEKSDDLFSEIRVRHPDFRLPARLTSGEDLHTENKWRSGENKKLSEQFSTHYTRQPFAAMAYSWDTRHNSDY